MCHASMPLLWRCLFINKSDNQSSVMAHEWVYFAYGGSSLWSIPRILGFKIYSTQKRALVVRE